MVRTTTQNKVRRFAWRLPGFRFVFGVRWTKRAIIVRYAKERSRLRRRIVPPFSQGGVLCSDEALTINVLYNMRTYAFCACVLDMHRKTGFFKFSEDGLGRGREDWLSACLFVYVGRDILNYSAALHEVPSCRLLLGCTPLKVLDMLLDMHIKTCIFKKRLDKC